ncbi:MAG: 1-acyl-sn-glycerol-3-phosphate acyltransferase [Phycisphaerae bacterium]|nr:1-acyl-sn-glycerol-3-phosphate acyltransferase [Phycisphaerae bacterium]MDW8261487.1 lysophospholipid acyltransferase family protein [Phycisphaerales bacterium]
MKDATERQPVVSDQMAAQKGLLRVMIAANEWFAYHYHELTVVSPCRLPASGPAILVCNHTSGVDPILLQAVCPRLVVWMMAKEYYQLRLLGFFFRWVGAIPVDRGGRDTSATRAAIRALQQGRVVGIFPEGKIELERELLPFQTGVALLACKTGAPVFPAYLDGEQRNREMLPSILRPSHAVVAFGEEVAFDRSDTSREGLERATAAIQASVQRLKERVDPTPH